MGSFSSFLSDAGDFLQETVVPVALGATVGFLGATLLRPPGGAAPSTVAVAPPPDLSRRLPFGLTPLMLGLIVAGILAVVFIVAM